MYFKAYLWEKSSLGHAISRKYAPLTLLALKKIIDISATNALIFIKCLI